MHKDIQLFDVHPRFAYFTSMVLKNHWEIITIIHYFDKFDTIILITMNYDTIIAYVDAYTQTANKIKIPKDHDPITFPSTIIFLQVFVCGNPPDPTDFLSQRLPQLSVYWTTPNFICDQPFHILTKVGHLPTLPYE